MEELTFNELLNISSRGFLKKLPQLGPVTKV
jgi:hypothetical protein